MDEVLKSYRELLDAARTHLAELAEIQSWVYADRDNINVEPAGSTRRDVPAPAFKPTSSPPTTSVPAKVSLPVPSPISTPELRLEEISKPHLITHTAKTRETDVPNTPNRLPSKEESPSEKTGKKTFSLTPRSPVPPPELTDLKKLIATIAPTLRLVETVPAVATTGLHRVPEGAIALILTPKNMSAEASAFLQAVAKAVELRFGPCGILDNHALVTAKQAFPPPGPRLIPIADPMLYLRDPLRKADLWNDIRRKLGTTRSRMAST